MGSIDMYTYQFCDVEDVLAKEHSHAHLDGPLLFLFIGKVRCWCVRQELQTSLIEVLLVFLPAIVSRIDLG